MTAPSAGRALASKKQYGYDVAGRMTSVNDRTATNTGIVLGATDAGTSTPSAPCVVREYSYDRNGNRTRLNTKSESGGRCSLASGATGSDVSYTYDDADRPLTAGAPTGTPEGAAYVYDPLGRQRVIPSADAPDSTRGDITLGYFDDDLVHTISQGGVTTTYQLDAEGRRLASTTTGSGTPGAGVTVRHYTDTSDNPALIVEPSGNAVRYTPSISGFGAIISSGGTATLAVANPHGDNVTTITIPASHGESTPATTIDGWADVDEFGNAKSGGQLASGYGYLGQYQRAATFDSAGLTLMGVRLYNAERGQFTSADPVLGGNSTAYAYPQDPVNDYDTSGAYSFSYSTYWSYLRCLCTYTWWGGTYGPQYRAKVLQVKVWLTKRETAALGSWQVGAVFWALQAVTFSYGSPKLTVPLWVLGGLNILAGRARHNGKSLYFAVRFFVGAAVRYFYGRNVTSWYPINLPSMTKCVAFQFWGWEY